MSRVFVEFELPCTIASLALTIFLLAECPPSHGQPNHILVVKNGPVERKAGGWKMENGLLHFLCTAFRADWEESKAAWEHRGNKRYDWGRTTPDIIPTHTSPGNDAPTPWVSINAGERRTPEKELTTIMASVVVLTLVILELSLLPGSEPQGAPLQSYGSPPEAIIVQTNFVWHKSLSHAIVERVATPRLMLGNVMTNGKFCMEHQDFSVQLRRLHRKKPGRVQTPTHRLAILSRVYRHTAHIEIIVIIILRVHQIRVPCAKFGCFSLPVSSPATWPPLARYNAIGNRDEVIAVSDNSKVAAISGVQTA
ncbi:hypothetical protein EDC04DRAFT_2598882 [Pisolithus marmoratus]|nr:hypothetical protein EDC04DRAFT_2598882 [Pisolithus marmoratus]